MINRISKDEYYIEIAKTVAQRSTCYRMRGGAIIVRDDQIISTGYIGAPRGTKDCFERGFCLRTKLKIPHGHRYELCRSVHCEQNAIINAARAGVSLLNGNMYLYMESASTGEPVDAIPCFICKKMIINAGLNKVIANTKENKIKIFLINDWVKQWQEADIIDDAEQYGDGEKILSQEEIDNNFKKI